MSDFLRTPPQSVESEQAVIGGILLRNDAYHQIAGWLTEADFYRRDHRLIYRAICEVLDAPADSEADRADAVTLGEWLEERGLSEEIGGPSYLIELASNTPSAANIVAYAEIVREKSLLRQLIEAGTELVNAGFAPEGKTSREIAALSLAKMQDLSGGARPRGPKTLRDIGKSWFARLSERVGAKGMLGLATPWAKFNALTAGFQPGQLIILAARPSMGKSAFAINAALACVMREDAKRVMFFNLEMSDESIYSRAVGCLQSVPLEWFRQPEEHDDEQWAQTVAAVKALQDRPLIVDDSPGLTMQQIVSRAKREHLKAPLDMVIIDHLHLIPLPGKTRETVEIGQITAAAKGLAKALKCPVVLLSQLNRSVEQRAMKRPVMADLRESGNIEQDADLIVFLYRDDYYAEQESRESESPGLVEIIIAKQRDGRTGKVWGKFRAEYGRIEDADEFDVPAPRVAKLSGIRGGKDRAAGE